MAGPRIQYFSETMPRFSKEHDKWQTATDTLHTVTVISSNLETVLFSAWPEIERDDVHASI